MQTITLNRAEVSEIIRGHIQDWFDFDDVQEKEFVVPVIPDLDAEILKHVDLGGLNMNNWHQYAKPLLGPDGRPRYHTCATTHCRAGWAIALGGEYGYELEKILNPRLAGSLIYHVSTGYIPDFFTNDKEAMEDMRRCAELTEKEGYR